METVINYKFKSKLKPKFKPIKVKDIRKISLLTKCLCFNNNGNWEAIVEIVNDDGSHSKVSMPFTKESYELKTKTNIFTINKVNKRHVRVVRSKEHAYTFPGSPDIYTPFCDGWVYSGYIYDIKGTLHFDIVETLYRDGCIPIS